MPRHHISLKLLRWAPSARQTPGARRQTPPLRSDSDSLLPPFPNTLTPTAPTQLRMHPRRMHLPIHAFANQLPCMAFALPSSPPPSRPASSLLPTTALRPHASRHSDLLSRLPLCYTQWAGGSLTMRPLTVGGTTATVHGSATCQDTPTKGCGRQVKGHARDGNGVVRHAPGRR